MTSMQEMVREFHKAAGISHPDKPVTPDPVQSAMRFRLMTEEAEEFFDAIMARDRVKAADAIADLLYITFGAAEELGMDIAPIFDLVHAANMRKFPDGKATFREDGKILKPEGWEGPEAAIEQELERQEREGRTPKVLDLPRTLGEQTWQEILRQARDREARDLERFGGPQPWPGVPAPTFPPPGGWMVPTTGTKWAHEPTVKNPPTIEWGANSQRLMPEDPK